MTRLRYYLCNDCTLQRELCVACSQSRVCYSIAGKQTKKQSCACKRRYDVTKRNVNECLYCLLNLKPSGGSTAQQWKLPCYD